MSAPQTGAGPTQVGEASRGPAPTLVVGIDLSLTGTGVARMCPELATAVVRSPLTGLERMRGITEELATWHSKADLVVVEGPSYGQLRQSGTHERAGLHWMLLHSLFLYMVPVVVVPPAVLKKYATGVGNAPKDRVLGAAYKRLPGFDGGNDEADAAWLAAMGLDHLTNGATRYVPASHAAVLGSVQWEDA